MSCYISSIYNLWSLYQLDINNAFLYSDLTKDGYTSLPEGYHSKDDAKGCKLIKYFYYLKQAPRKWNEKLWPSLSNFGFKQSINDYSLLVIIIIKLLLCY